MAPTRKKSPTPASPKAISAGKRQKRELVMPSTAASSPMSRPSRLPPTPQYSQRSPRTPEEFPRDLSPLEYRSFRAYRDAILGIRSDDGHPGQPGLPATIRPSDQFVVEKGQSPRKTSVVLISPRGESMVEKSAKISPSLLPDDSSSEDEDGGSATEDEYDDHNDLDYVRSEEQELYSPSSSDQDDDVPFLRDSDDTDSSSYDSDLFVQQQSRRGTVTSEGYVGDAELTPRVHFEDEPVPLPQGGRSSFELRYGNAREVPVDDSTDGEGESALDSPTPQSNQVANGRGARSVIHSDDTYSEGGIFPRQTFLERRNARGEEVPSDEESSDDQDASNLDEDDDDVVEDQDDIHEDEVEDETDGYHNPSGGETPEGSLQFRPPAPPLNFGDNFSDSEEHDVSDCDIQCDPIAEDAQILTGDDDGTRLGPRLPPGWSGSADLHQVRPRFDLPDGRTEWFLPPPPFRNTTHRLSGARLWVVDPQAVYDVWDSYGLPYPIPWPLPLWHPPAVGRNHRRLLPPGWSSHDYALYRPERLYYYVDPQGQYHWFAPVHVDRAPEFNTTHQYGPDGLLHPLTGPHVFRPPRLTVLERARFDGTIRGLYRRPGASPLQQLRPLRQLQQQNTGLAGNAGNARPSEDDGDDDDGDDDDDDDDDDNENNSAPRGTKRPRSPGSSSNGSSSRPHKRPRTSSRGHDGNDEDPGAADSDRRDSEIEAERAALLERIAELEGRNESLFNQRNLSLDDAEAAHNKADDVEEDLVKCREHGARLTSENDELRRQLDELDKQLEELRTQLEECREHGRQLQNRLTTAERQRDEARTARNNVPQRGHASSSIVRRGADAAGEGSDNCREKCKQLERQIKDLEDQVKRAESNQANMEAKYEHQLDLRRKLEDRSRADIEKWKANYMETKQKLQEALKRATETRQQPGAPGDSGEDPDCEGRCRRAEKEVWDIENQRKALEQLYEQLVLESDRTEKDLRRQLRAAEVQLAAQTSATGHRGNARYLDERVAALENDMKNAKEVNRKLEDALEIARKELKKVSALAREKVDEAASLQKQLDECEKHREASQKGGRTAAGSAPAAKKASPTKKNAKTPVKPKGKGKQAVKTKAQVVCRRGSDGRLVRVAVESEESEPEAEPEEEDDAAVGHAATGSPTAEDIINRVGASDDSSSSSSDTPLMTARARSSAFHRTIPRSRCEPPHTRPLTPRAPPRFTSRVSKLQHKLRVAKVRTNRILKWHAREQEAHLELRMQFDRLMEENGMLKRGKEALIREVKGLVGVIEGGRR